MRTHFGRAWAALLEPELVIFHQGVIVISRKKLSLIVLSTVGLGATRGWSEPPSYVQLSQRVRELEAKVESIESQKVSQPDQDATIRAVLDDAQRRSHLLANGGA